MKITEWLNGNNNEADVVDLGQLYRAAIARRNFSIARESRRDSARSYASPLVAGVAVVTAHAAALLMLLHEWRPPPDQGTQGEVSHQTTVSFIEPARIHDAVILPEVQFVSSRLDDTPITRVSFEDPDADLQIPRHAGPGFHVMSGRYSTACRATVPW